MSYKNFYLVPFIFFSFYLHLQAQELEINNHAFSSGSWELNLSGDFGSQSMSTEYKSQGNSSESSSDYMYFQLHIIPGIYIIDGLSFEPELDFLFIEESEPSFSFIPNLSYTYRFPTSSNLALYCRAGYGLSNSYNLFGFLFRTSSSLEIGVLNLGVGLKFLVSENFCLRSEINYRRSTYTEEESSYYYSYERTNTISNIRLLLGFSVLI